MPKHPSVEHLGEPTLRIAGLQIWIHGLESPGVTEPDDDWFQCTVHCGASRASVFVTGSILMVADVVQWGKQVALLSEGKEEKAVLGRIEPELAVRIDSPDSRGHFRLHVEITPDYLNQKHVFDFEIDQTYLPPIVNQCRKVREQYLPAGL